MFLVEGTIFATGSKSDLHGDSKAAIRIALDTFLV